jgi:ABC-type branched-subunit amino acid transport system ATPase component
MFAARDIVVEYGGVRAVDGVSLQTSAQEVVGLVGPNGSGKTSLLNALTGLTRCRGTALLNGTELDLRNPVAVRRSGVSRTFQAPQIYEVLTCLENVLLGCMPDQGTGLPSALLNPPRVWRTEQARRDSAMLALNRVDLAGLALEPSATLAYGLRRLLDLARAVAALPRVLMLDEPSAGLNQLETVALGRALRQLRDEGVALLVVDHKVKFLDGLCDRIVFLEQGRVVAEGSPSEVWSDARVIDAYLGTVPGA